MEKEVNEAVGTSPVVYYNPLGLTFKEHQETKT